MSMHSWFKFSIVLMLSMLLVACSGGSTSQQASPEQPQIPAPPAELPANRVEVVYSHMHMRCGTCICFEQRIEYVVATYFQDELKSGKLVFDKVDLSDRQKAPLFRKYDAWGSQFFVNTVINNVDSIKDIEGIWDWRCEKDKSGFDANVRSAIELSLQRVQ